MVRVLIVDEHPMVRLGVSAVLARTLPGVSIHEASDGAEALQAIGHEAWDLVLMGLSMPGRPGLEILKQIRVLRPRLPILVLSMYLESTGL